MVRWTAWAWFLVAASAVAHAGDESSLTSEDRRAFAWFDQLAFPSTAGKPFVRVLDAPHFVARSRPDSIEGFLLAEDDASSTVLTDSLVAWRVPKSEGAEIERRDLAVVAKGRLDFSAGSSTAVPPSFFDSRGFERIGKRAELLGFARHCAENGLDRVAHDMLDAARRTRGGRGETDARPVEDAVADEMAAALIWRYTLDFGDASIPRTRLLREFRGFVACFPRSEHLAKARETFDVLERMVREDEEHAKSVRAWDDMTKEERVAELIWRLRDAPGGQMMQPGSPSFYGEDDVKHPTALAQLVALGTDAVPQLIPAIGDVRFTRCVGFWRNFTFSHYVQRVGDAALQALQRIAHRSFWQGTYTAAAMAKDGQAGDVRERVEKWWAECRTKGEKQVLVEAVEAGDMNSCGSLDRLIEVHPDAAESAALEGLRVAIGAARSNLLGPACKIRTEKMTAFFADEAMRGPTTLCRGVAACEAVDRGRLDVAPSMIGQLRRIRSAPSDLDDEFAVSFVVSALVRSGTPEALDALAAAFVAAEPRVLQSLLGPLVLELPGLSKRAGYPSESLRAAEDLVVRCMDDQRETGWTQTANDRSVAVRICDIAATGLARAWGLTFDSTADMDARDAAIVAIREAWRTRRNTTTPR